jgi:hypothetical protein
MATDTHATIKVLLEMGFSMVVCVIRKTTGGTKSVLYKNLWRKENTVGRQPLLTEELSLEAEDQPLLEAITRKLLVRTLLAEITCEVWKSVTTL